VLASIAPDVDAVLMPFGWDRYLLWHQRGTHALVGTAIDAVVFALIFRVVLELWRRVIARAAPDAAPGKPAPTAPPARLLHLMLAAWLGSLGHITLDLISGGTIRLFAPLSTEPYGVPWMAMADPLIAVPLALFAIAWWWFRRRELARVRRFAWITLIVLAAIVGVKELSRRAAIDAYMRMVEIEAGTPRATIPPPAIEGAWASFTRWFAFDRAGSPMRLRALEVDAWRGTVRPLFSRPMMPRVGDTNTDALMSASATLETVRHLAELHDLTFMEIRPHGRRDGNDDAGDRLVDVLWSDIRYCGETDCALWFGGTFDRETFKPREQLVIVGSIRQTRP
jgi:hypothetical protein